MLRRLLVDAQYRLACRIAPAEPTHMDGSNYAGKSKLRMLLGEEIVPALQGRTVIDFGCGTGDDLIEAVRLGAARGIGIDIREEVLAVARRQAQAAGVADRCTFATETSERADLVISLDSFEHFADPGHMLELMHELLVPGGMVWASFGPTWGHPLGGHLFSIFPWAHIVLSEEALIRWRSRIRDDGATRFEEVSGGLNRMTIARFERIVRDSPFELVRLQPVPIRRLKPLHHRLTREFTTAIVRCQLRKRPVVAA
jgi:SAM-dependent methyltransferase